MNYINRDSWFVIRDSCTARPASHVAARKLSAQRTPLSTQHSALSTLFSCLLLPAAALADEVRHSERTYHNAEISHFDGEFVIFANEAGQPVAKRLGEIEAIVVDSITHPDALNRAEALWDQKRYREAAGKYLLALPRAQGFWKHLVRARYLASCDRAGDLDRAVATFVELARLFPEKAHALVPQNTAGADPDTQARALEILEKALPTFAEQAVYWHLEALRLSILEVTESEQAGKVAHHILTELYRLKEGPADHRLQLIAIRIAVRHQQYEMSLRHINEIIPEVGEAYLSELLFLKGRSLFQLAEGADDFKRAGLAFARVVIHFPKSRFCAKSMHWAGRVHEKINRPRKALELYRSCAELSGADQNIVALADEAIARLRASQPAFGPPQAGQ